MEEYRIKIDPVKVFVVVIQLAFIILMTIVVRDWFKKKDEIATVEINNYSEIPSGELIGPVSINYGYADLKSGFELDDTKKSVLEGALYDVASMNNTSEIPANGARIRENSVSYAYIEDLDVYLLNFLVDIDELKQSYRLVYRWTNRYPNSSVPSNGPAMAFCPYREELIYDDFECKDLYNNRGNDRVVYDLLKNKSFNDFGIEFVGNVLEGDPLNMEIYIVGLGPADDSARARTIDTLGSWLNKIGFSLEKFTYYFK